MIKATLCVLLLGAAVTSSAALTANPATAGFNPTPPPACGDGKNRRVKMVNDTSFTIVRLYGSNAGADSWQEDVLGDSTLKPGGTVTVNWDDGTCYCSFDFKAVYEDGDTSTKTGVNVCNVSNFRFYE